METLGKTLVLFALVLAVVGGFTLLLSRLGLTRLPGDIVVRGKHVTLYVPLGLSIVLSLLLTLLLNLLSRR